MGAPQIRRGRLARLLLEGSYLGAFFCLPFANCRLATMARRVNVSPTTEAPAVRSASASGPLSS